MNIIYTLSNGIRYYKSINFFGDKKVLILILKHDKKVLIII